MRPQAARANPEPLCSPTPFLLHPINLCKLPSNIRIVSQWRRRLCVPCLARCLPAAVRVLATAPCTSSSIKVYSHPICKNGCTAATSKSAARMQGMSQAGTARRRLGPQARLGQGAVRHLTSASRRSPAACGNDAARRREAQGLHFAGRRQGDAAGACGAHLLSPLLAGGRAAAAAALKCATSQRFEAASRLQTRRQQLVGRRASSDCRAMRTRLPATVLHIRPDLDAPVVLRLRRRRQLLGQASSSCPRSHRPV